MVKRLAMCVLALMAACSLVEYLWGLTPLEQALRLGGLGKSRGVAGKTVIRLAVASWQMDEFPWLETAARYEADHPDVRVELSTLPEGSFNSILLSWTLGRTEYDAIVAFADEEIHPFIDYCWSSKDPARRSLLVDVREYLSREQLEAFEPALFGGCSRTDPDTGQIRSYELPWMGEVLALNYNKKFFAERGVEIPRTWEELETACQKLMGLEHDGQKVAPLAMNFSQGVFFAQNCYIPMLCSFKARPGETLPPGRSWVMDEKGRLDVSSPEALKVFETLKRWSDAGYISRNAFSGENIEQDLRVLRAAMYPHWQSRGLWAVKDQGPDVIGLAPSPGSRGVGSLMCTYGCLIPKCSPAVRKTIEFCYETFCTDKYGFQSAVAKGVPDPKFPNDMTRNKGGGKLPVLKEMFSRPDLPPGVAELGKGLANGYSYPDPANWGQCSNIVVVEFEKYLAGIHKSAREALNAIQKRFAEEVY